MAKRKSDEVVLDLGPGDYQLCKEALSCIAQGKASGSRIMAACRYNGREMWGIVVEMWDDARKRVGGEIAHLTVRASGKTTAWPGTLSEYQDQDPLPWEA